MPDGHLTAGLIRPALVQEEVAVEGAAFLMMLAS